MTPPEQIPKDLTVPQGSPDYLAHDGVYQKLRARGANGWNNEQADDYVQMLSFIAPALPKVEGSRPLKLLELGCGAGNFSALLAEQGFDVTGVDISPTAIEWAIERAAKLALELTFHTDDVVLLRSIAPSSFDVLVDGHCLHCIIGEDRALCLASAMRVLAPGGTLVVLTMCGEVTGPTMLANFDTATKTIVHQGRPTRYIGAAADICKEIEHCGFVIEVAHVVPRADADDLDNLVVRARKPLHASVAFGI